MKIAILDDYQDIVKSLDCYKVLNGFDVTVFNKAPASDHELMDLLSDKDSIVLIRQRTNITRNLLSKLPNLKLISQIGKVGQHVDLGACNDYRIAVAEGTGSPVAPAELCWALVIAASRHIVPYAENLKEGNWQDAGPLGLGRVLNGLTMGILGYGKIGKMVAHYARAFGMNVVIWGSEQTREQARSDGYESFYNKEQCFSNSDVLSLHLRLTPSTAGSVTYNDLQLMKRDALIVNMSRAELIEPNALYLSLKTGRPGSAAIDVYCSEPAQPEKEPLLNMPNVLCTPHLGYVERNSYELHFKIAFENIVSYFSGHPQNIANPEVLRSHKPQK